MTSLPLFSSVDIGFTGNQFGMTEKQKDSFRLILTNLEPKYFRHGDCVGSDTDAHEIVLESNIEILIHPPDNPSKRAFNEEAFKVFEEKPYLNRNQDIVDGCTVLIATPKEYRENLRSGTWSTIRMARKAKRNIYIILPNGKVIRENAES